MPYRDLVITLPSLPRHRRNISCINVFVWVAQIELHQSTKLPLTTTGLTYELMVEDLRSPTSPFLENQLQQATSSSKKGYIASTTARCLYSKRVEVGCLGTKIPSRP